MKNQPSQSDPQTRHFRIHGMDCAEEVAVLKRELGPVVGAEDQLAFDVLRGRLTVSSQAGEVSSSSILEAVERTGMRGELWDEVPPSGAGSSRWYDQSRFVLTGLSGFAILAAVICQSWLADRWPWAFTDATIPLAAKIFYGIAIISGIWLVAPKAWYALRRFRPDMNLLMIIAVLGAVLIGELLEAAMVAFLFSLSLLIESWSVGRARRAVEALMDLSAPMVRLKQQDGTERETEPEKVEVGSLFVVKPGERIPLDGELTEGTSHVNQAPITGESQPVVKQVGESVFAGTINGDGAIIVRSTKIAEETTLANIIRLVGEAHSRKAPSEQWVEKFARVYTPTVMVIAFGVLLVPPLLAGQPWDRWLYSSLVFLVIACPCALVISTPVSIVAALAAAARQGVLVKGGVFMEAPARLRAIAFDKTGTLTEGEPSVVEVVPLAGHTELELLERVATLESRSEHPLARAILQYAIEKGIKPSPADDFEIIQGKGAQGHFNGRLFWLGSHRYLEERGQETPEIHQRLEQLASSGRTVVVVGNEEHVCGLIALADEIRPSTRTILDELRGAGIEHLIMLTGDNIPTAKAIAARVGVDEVRAELLPEEKVQAMDRLLEQYGAVAMVGDGVNDAPALARATLGIAMGAAGTDAAIETADIALMTDNLSRLPWLVRHSRRTLSIIRQNIAFSLAVKAVFMALTLFGAASLWAAIASDTGASLLVIFNGLRLLHTDE